MISRLCWASWVLVALGFTSVLSLSGAQTNAWMKSGSGYWEEPYWSLGRLPARQDIVLFVTPGYRALAIGPNTSTTVPQSLSMQSLVIDVPSDSFNQLLLNWAGFGVPLSVSSNLVIGANGSLVSHSSALVAGSLVLNATADFLDQSDASFTHVFVGPDLGAELRLTNSDFAAGWLQLGASQSPGAGVVNQSGGTNQIGTLALFPGSTYRLADGGRLAGISLEMHTLGRTGDARFTQTGGSATFISAGNVSGSDPNSFARLSLASGSFRVTDLSLNNGSFVQTGGTNLVGMVQLSPNVSTSGSYTLSDGLLTSSNFAAGVGPGHQPPAATFTQTGGRHTNGTLILAGTLRSGFALPFGSYFLENGLLVSDNESIQMGSMSQTGGTNQVGRLSVSHGGSYRLAGGLLLSSNAWLVAPQVETLFDQNGGSHRIPGVLSLDRLVTYGLSAGTLEVANIELNPGSRLLAQGGTVTNASLCTINGGLLSVGAPELQLGRLCVTGSNSLVATRPPNSTIAFLPGAVSLRFRDSRNLAWDPPGLCIQNWRSNGAHHIYVGTNSYALTAWQLSLVTFSNPGGLPPGDYPAAMLADGELVPSAQGPILGYTRQSGNLVLSWSGSYQLCTATNAAGPYTPLDRASSPYVSAFTAGQRFFRLKSE